MKKEILKYSIILVMIFSVGLVVLFGYGESYTEEYYESFGFTSQSKGVRQVYFITEIKDIDVHNSWYIKVYYDKNHKWVKFESYNKKNGNSKLLRTINNTFSDQAPHNPDDSNKKTSVSLKK